MNVIGLVLLFVAFLILVVRLLEMIWVRLVLAIIKKRPLFLVRRLFRR